MIKKGLIKLNGVTISSPKFVVSDPADIHIEKECLEESLIVAENIPLEIAYEDEDLIVINKPTGMVVHPAHGHNTRNIGKCLVVSL